MHLKDLSQMLCRNSPGRDPTVTVHMQSYPGARRALEQRHRCRAEREAGALGAAASSPGTPQAPRWPGLMQR